MKARALLSAAISVTLGGAIPGHAQNMVDVPVLSGDVLDVCGQSKAAMRMVCAAYLHGAFEGLMFGQASATGGRVSFCPPPQGITLEDMRSSFLEFLAHRPEEREASASLALLMALEDQYPCEGDDGDTAPDPGLPDGPPAAGQPPSMDDAPILNTNVGTRRGGRAFIASRSEATPVR
jgi:hypothetical protein